MDPEFADDGWTRFVRNMRSLAQQANEAGVQDLANLAQLADFKTMEQIRGRVDETIQDPLLADKLKAYYNQFCKRPTFHDDYLETFNRDNVELIDVSATQGVERITERGFVANGRRVRGGLHRLRQRF